MDIKRLFKHLFTTRASVKACFPELSLAVIKSAIEAAEDTHRGELRFVIEAALTPAQILAGVTARERALEVFSDLRIWDTELNSGVLIYVLFADRAVEIVADRGINQRASQAWGPIVAAMQEAYSAGFYEAGTLAGITAIEAELVKHFPLGEAGNNPDELHNDAVLL
jgi:uncharacterized membrane protein